MNNRTKERKEIEKGAQQIFKEKNGWEFFKISNKHQIIDPGSWENLKKYHKSTPKHIIFKLKKKIKRK